MPKPAIKAVSVVKKTFTIELMALLFSGALNACGALILSPVLPFYAMRNRASALDLALMSSAYSFCQMVSSPLMGNLSDRVGRRPVLLAGIAASSAFFFHQAMADTVPKLLLSRAALGLAAGTLPVEVAYITDLTTREERPKVLRRQSQLIMAGAFLGPPVGAIFAGEGFPTLCHIMGGVCLLNFVLGLLFFTEPPKQQEVTPSAPADDKSNEPTPVMSRFRNKTSSLLLFAAFMDCFALAVSDGPEAYFLRNNFNFGEPQLAGFFMVCSATSLIVANMVSWVLSWLRPKLACMLFSLGSAASVSTLFIFRDAFEPYLYASLSSCTVTIVESVSTSALISSLVTLDQQGTMYGIESALLNAGFFLGPPLGGILFGYHNYAPYAVSLACFVLSAFAYALLPKISAQDALLRTKSGTTKTINHLVDKGPLPNRAFAMHVVAADRARQTWFVDQEMHAPFQEVQRWHKQHGLRKVLNSSW
uniref:Major facilitator superfamily (MFS) profile domain-containing protein n=1 Tax=Alexandrium monilatum TaxID=311494 RepID=A0A7S4UCT5_9DINO